MLLDRGKVIFPSSEVEAVLREGLRGTVEARSLITGDASGGEEIDSLSCVELLCEVDAILGFEIKHKIVRPGGYRSIQSAIDHLMPGIERLWKKRGGL